MDKAKLRIAAAISVAVGLPAAGAVGASAAEFAAPHPAGKANLLQPPPTAVARLKVAGVQAASREASKPPVIRVQYDYRYCRGYWRRDEYGRSYYYNPCRTYPHGRYYYNPYPYPYRDEYGRYYNPYRAYPYRDEYGRYYNPYGAEPNDYDVPRDRP